MEGLQEGRQVVKVRPGWLLPCCKQVKSYHDGQGTAVFNKLLLCHLSVGESVNVLQSEPVNGKIWVEAFSCMNRTSVEFF